MPVLLFTAVLAYASLYAPQPVLPLLSQQLQVDAGHISLLISATLLPLSLAPIFYGLILQRVSAQRLLRQAVAALAITQLLLPLIEHFWLFVTLRFIQGLLLPAIFTALMTYIANCHSGERIRWVMSQYIAATILGGFSGRLVSGASVAWLGNWQPAFWLIAGGLALAWWWLARLPADAQAGFSAIHPRLALQVLRQPLYRAGYWIIFLLFLVFASLLNTLPFYLRQLAPQLSELGVALVYSGYLIGIVTALGSQHVAQRVGGEASAIILGLLGYALAVVLFVSPSLWIVFATMWLFCAGMFLVHALLSGLLNQAAGPRKGIVNGLYIACYYAGGTIGSFLPGLLYRSAGWGAYLALLLAAVLLCLPAALYLQRHNSRLRV